MKQTLLKQGSAAKAEAVSKTFTASDMLAKE